MTSPIINVSQQRWARIAGCALLMICLSALLSNNLTVAGNASATANNILAHDRQFRIGIWGELIMLNGDVVLGAALYALLKPVNAPLALLGTLWRFANALLLGIGVVVSLVALDILEASRHGPALSADQIQITARQLLDIHGTAMEVGLIFFGLGAFVHALLLWKSSYIPRPLSGAYLVVALLIFVSFSSVIVFPALDAIIDPWAIAPDFIVELAVAFWLVVMGAKIGPPPTVHPA